MGENVKHSISDVIVNVTWPVKICLGIEPQSSFCGFAFIAIACGKYHIKISLLLR